MSRADTEAVMGAGTEKRKAAGVCPTCGKSPRYFYRWPWPGAKWTCGECHTDAARFMHE